MKGTSPSDAALDRVRAICHPFPGVEEKLSHGTPAFFVRGRMFVMFVDDHHGDDRFGVWCKSDHEEQRRLVAADPVRFFVPPYVGVKGWVGVRLDGTGTDWIELAILLERGWTALAPTGPGRASSKPARGRAAEPARPPPPVRRKTDPELARSSLEKLSAIGLALPEATREGASRHASFRVRKKNFAYFLDNHHGDGEIGICFKVPRGKQNAVVSSDPARFYLPAYLGSWGWVALRVTARMRRADWDDVAARVLTSYVATAPKKLATAAAAPSAGAKRKPPR
jgi:hypothetical protein